MDDDLTRRLRALADTDAPVTVDHDAVLRAGHRRRWARAVGTSGALAALVVGGYPAVAALSTDRVATPPAASATAEPPRAVVDRATGTITVPGWGVPPSTEEDRAVMQTARAFFFAGCMADQGFAEGWEFTGPVTPAPAPGERYPYGAWLADDVRANGYGFARSGALDLPPAEAEAWDVCEARLETTGLSGAVEVTLDKHEGALRQTERALLTDEGRSLHDAWAACLAESGVAAVADDPESLVPAGAAEAPFDEQVRIGLVDVACKDRLDLVQRLADIDAALAAQFAADHREEIAAELAEAERRDRPVVDRARAYLAEHGVTMP